MMPLKYKVYIAYYLFVKYKPRPDVPPGLVHSSQQPESEFQEFPGGQVEGQKATHGVKMPDYKCENTVYFSIGV